MTSASDSEARGCAVDRSPEQRKSVSAERVDSRLCEDDDDYAVHERFLATFAI